MEEFYRYPIGKDIAIHSNLNNPNVWYLTIKPLEIYNKPICEKTCTNQEIARYVNVELHKKLIIINDLIKEVIPFT